MTVAEFGLAIRNTLNELKEGCILILLKYYGKEHCRQF